MQTSPEKFTKILDMLNGIFIDSQGYCVVCGTFMDGVPSKGAIIRQHLDLEDLGLYSCIGVIVCRDCEPKPQKVFEYILDDLKKSEGVFIKNEE